MAKAVMADRQRADGRTYLSEFLFSVFGAGCAEEGWDKQAAASLCILYGLWKATYYSGVWFAVYIPYLRVLWEVMMVNLLRVG